MASSALLSLLLLAAAASASAWTLPTGPGNSYCPVISGNWANGGTTPGLIYNENGAYLLKVEDPLVLTVSDCASRCYNTPKCAFYSFLDFHGYFTTDCYLFSCGACADSLAFNHQATISAQVTARRRLLTTTGLVTKTFTYVSGAVPSALAQCTNVKGDPHFSGADNSHFEFTGVPNTTYAMLSDAHMHINMHLGGRYAQWGEATTPLTWIRQVGILWGKHTVAFKAREGARWQYDNGYMSSIEVDGTPVRLSDPGDMAAFADGKIEITWVAAQHRDGDDEIDVYLVRIADVLSLRLKLRPEVAHLRTESDGVVHFSVEVPQVIVSENAHGVLGQTYRRDHRNRLSQQKLVYSKLLGTDVVPTENGKGFLDGEPEDYAVPSLLSTDCKLSRFAHATGLDVETARAIEISSGAAHSKHTVPEKFLRIANSFRKLLR